MRILFAGYYGFDNAGDELILSSLLSEMYHRVPKAEAFVLSASLARTRELHQVNPVYRWNPCSIWRILKKIDVFILGGGDLFQDGTSARTLPYYALLCLLARLRGVSVHICGVSFEKLMRGRISQKIVLKSIEIASSISVRDQESHDYLLSLGCKKEIRVLSDSVLSLPEVDSPNMGEDLQTAVVLRHQIVPEDIGAHLLQFTERTGCKVVLIPFCPSDKAISKKVAQEIGKNASCEDWQNIRNLRKIFSQMNFVMTQRLHGLILSSLHSIPCVALPSWSKVGRFAKILGAEAMQSIDGMQLEKAWDKRLAIRQRMRECLPDLRQRAKIIMDIF